MVLLRIFRISLTSEPFSLFFASTFSYVKSVILLFQSEMHVICLCAVVEKAILVKHGFEHWVNTFEKERVTSRSLEKHNL